MLIVEEVLCLQSDFSDINLSLSFSEKDVSLELVCESAGIPLNPLEEGVLDDDIGLKLIKSCCKSVDYNYLNGKNNLVLIVKGE